MLGGRPAKSTSLGISLKSLCSIETLVSIRQVGTCPGWFGWQGIATYTVYLARVASWSLGTRRVCMHQHVAMHVISIHPEIHERQPDSGTCLFDNPDGKTPSVSVVIAQPTGVL